MEAQVEEAPGLFWLDLVLGVLVFGFLLLKLAPGDPAMVMAGEWTWKKFHSTRRYN